MNNIRKIIEERLDNARNDYEKAWSGTTLYNLCDILQSQIEAYQDCLNLMQPRTEQDILNDFEELGWKVVVNNKYELELHKNENKIKSLFVLNILKSAREYQKYIITNGKEFAYEIKYQEHNLLNELFICWGWE